jgi:myosin V
MQIQYNITRIEEWCKSHNMPEGTLQLEHLMQATKLLQLKKATPADIEIIYDVCWMLSPMQIQRMCTNYYVADYEVCFLFTFERIDTDNFSEPYIP